jgi:uncharacterized protein
MIIPFLQSKVGKRVFVSGQPLRYICPMKGQSLLVWGLLCLLALAPACREGQPAQSQPKKTRSMKTPVVYFEIPVTDMDRATQFYAAVFGADFELDTIDGNQMALFPLAEDGGITGALAKGETYRPSLEGTLVYFRVANIDTTLALALAHGGKVLFPKTSNDGTYFVAELADSEGNRVALHQLAQ